MKNSWDKDAIDYDKKVYSITKWKEKRDRILNELKDGQKILILGCGSETYLQKDIVKRYPNSKLLLTDFSKKMIKVSKKNFSNENLSFKVEDMMKMNYQEEFNVIISTNSILMETVKKNSKVFNLCYQALKKEGKLIAYLPSFESVLKTLESKPKAFKVNKKEQRVIDPVDGTKQSFHTSESIEKNLRKFRTLSQKKVFCSESKAELDYFVSLYGEVFSKEIIKKIFEWFIVSKK